MDTLENGGDSRLGTAATKSPLSAMYTAAINQSSSLFNDQASASHPGNEPDPSGKQAERTSLFGDWESSMEVSHNTNPPLFEEDEGIPSLAAESKNTTPIFASNEKPSSLYGKIEEEPVKTEYTPLFGNVSPRLYPPTLFGIPMESLGIDPKRIDYSQKRDVSAMEAKSLELDIIEQSKRGSNILEPEEYARSMTARVMEVGRILEKVNCLDDLTDDVVRQLMATDYGLLTIDKFQVWAPSIPQVIIL